MKTKKFINGFALALSTVLASMFVACNPEKPENEKENKLHEDPVRAVFMLQEGTLDDAANFDKTPKMANFKASPTVAAGKRRMPATLSFSCRAFFSGRIAV